MSIAPEVVDDIPNRPPLGLPTGSIRAILTLLTLSIVIHDVLSGVKLEIIWVEMLLIAMAHYFTSRRFVRLSPAVLRRLEEEGSLPREANPLFLPRHSMQLIIIAALTGMGVILYQQHKLFGSDALLILGTIPAYLLGVIVRTFGNWCTGGRQTAIGRVWDDLIAVAVILTLGACTAIHFQSGATKIPPEFQTGIVALVLYYFGSR